MKKVFIIIAIVLAVAGLLFLAYAFITTGFDLSKFGASKYVTNTYAVDKEFTKIMIDSKETDIVLKPSKDGKASVVCEEREKAKHSVSVEDGTLKIVMDDKRSWFDFISFFSKSMTMTVYLPSDEYEEFSVDCGTGDVTVTDAFKFGELEIDLSTGAITLENISADKITLDLSTGSTDVKSVSCKGDFKVDVSTGKTMIAGLTCTNFSSEGSTGDVTLKDVVASGSLYVDRSTGDVLFENSDAGNIKVDTSTGSVEGTLRTEKVFIAKTSTGSVDVPSTTSGGKCEISTSTGDIEIKLAK